MTTQAARNRLAFLAPLILIGGIATAADDSNGNLIANGDFSQGATGFRSELPYTKPEFNCLWPGCFTIAHSFDNPLLHRLLAPSPFGSPTKRTGKENVFFANAGGVEPVTVWASDVKCKPNTRYLISFYCMSMSGYVLDGSPPRQIATKEWQPDFEVWVNGQPSAPIQAGLGVYTKGSMSWESKDATSATVKIVRAKIAHGGGLIAIADIRMVPAK